MVYVTCPGERPPFGVVPVFLWGHECDFDSDGDALDWKSGSWTELFVSLRGGSDAEFVEINLHQESPLVLAICSPNSELVYRAAYILAHYSGGKVKRGEQGVYGNAEDFANNLGKDFDLGTAIIQFNEAVTKYLPNNDESNNQ
jgi:hypothetical protein